MRIRLAEVLQEAAQDQPTAPLPDGEAVLRQVEHERRGRLPWLVLGLLALVLLAVLLGWLRPWAHTSPGPTPGAPVQGSDPASSPPS
ncbi:hypothetical protein [Luteococcus peritonei]|uniref:Uncharacterized protein n=1 Tax=Luteococcus peritonei TaxID=88874 RepID=A0ABW4RYA2_9ACTN